MEKVSAVSNPSSTANEDDSQQSVKSFRRKKFVRKRLSPLADSDAVVANVTKAPHSPPASPRQQQQKSDIVVVLDDSDLDDVDKLKQAHALLHSEDEVERWISSYETEKAQFASFALFTEMKLDQIQGPYVELAGRPNAVEVAACCASLCKMPGIVGCYKSLLEKLAVGIQSAIYLPAVSSTSTSTTSSQGSAQKAIHALANMPMSSLVHNFYSRKSYFARLREVERQLMARRDITDPATLKSLSATDVEHFFLGVPFPTLGDGLRAAVARNASFSTKLQKLLSDRSSGLNQLDRGGHRGADGDDDDYPFHVPLCSSAQICRAIGQNAENFSSSGKEMILCSIIEFVEVESFKDVFKRFDAHGKMCFLHHLSVLESTDHLQMIVEQLPNAGETVFRFYLVSCGSNSEECQRAKNVFFHKILGPEMEHYFLTDLAAYLNEDHWLFLGKEYDKHLQDRLNRKHLRLQMMADGDESNEETNDQESNEQKDVSASSMEQFQLMMWNFLHQNRLDSAQVLSLIQTTMLPSLEEKEQSALMDTCLDHFQTLEAKWRRLLLFVEEIEADSGTTGIDNVRMIRIKMLKRLFSMLSRDERVTWLEKINKKYGFQTAAPRKLEHQQSSVIMVPVNLDDPKPHVLLMKMDIKMAWMECLLDAIANDKEYSARMTMLKQVLRPFLNGETLPAAGSGAVAVVQQKMTLAAGEKAINNILNNFNIPDKLKLMQKFATDDTRTARKMDRASSPVKELEEQPQIISVPDPTLLPTNNEDILTALRELLLRKSEQDVLKILTDAMITKPGTPSELVAVPEVDAMEEEAPITKPLQRSPSKSNSVRGSFKRKVTAVVAMSEPMEWQRFVKIGMVDVGCQTTFEDRSPSPQDDGYEAQSFSSSQVPVFTRNRPQLTLNALLPKQPIGPGRKTKESKYQKINSGAVPRPIASLITSWRMNTDQLVQFAKKSLPTVLRIVADALGESLTAGRRKSNQPSLINRGRDLTLAQIVYQSFLHSYGLPGIADMHLLAFSCAIETYRTQHLRVEHFARYCFEEVTRFELQYYLEFLECIVCDDANLIGSTLAATNRAGGPQQAQPVGAAAAPRRMRYVPRVVVPDKENWTIPVEKAQEAAQLCFRAMRKPSVTAFCDRLVALAMQGTSAVLDSATGAMLASTTVHTATAAAVAAAATAAASSPNQAVPSDLFINVDFLLQLVVLEWRDEQLRRENHLLDAFRAGDVNGDGQLTSAEFTQIVLSIDRNRDLGEILLMYSDTVRRTQCEAINTEVFLQVARKHELDKMAWSEDGDLHNITNTVSDLESTWAQVRSFFLGTLEALVRDLTTQHFLRNCEGAGCGCLKCILDSYIGFQRMRRDFDLAQRGKSTRAYPISESLVWGRFWHLMRQLYEASSASDGILTPWEGSEYMRTEPAPPMASRLITLRRDALPNFLFPDTNRISAVVSSVNEQESYDADEINRRFVNLHGLMTYREAEATSNNTPS